MKSYLNKIIMICLIAISISIQVNNSCAEEVVKVASSETGINMNDPAISPESPKANGGLKTALTTDKEAVKQIQTKQVETTNQIKQITKEADQLRVDAQRLAEDKRSIEKEAEVKNQEAVALKEEAKVVMAEAARTGDAQAKQKAQELSQEAKKLESEAQIGQEKAKVAGLKAEAGEQKVLANQTAIEAMKKELEGLRKEKNMRRGIIDKLIYGGIIVLIGVFLLWLLGFAIKRFELLISEKDAIRESEKTLRIKTLSGLFKWAGSLIIFGAVMYMVLDNFGINMAPFLAGAGIVGLAFGFGGQYLIRDIINGIFILIEGQYRINDVVKIGDTGGLVENINLRVTKLRDMEGRVIYIPNGEVKTVINFTQEYAQAVLEIGVAYKENVDHVMTVIKELAAVMRKDKDFEKLILADLEMLGVDAFADSQVTIKCRFKTLPIKQWAVAREFRRRIKNKFDELGIEIPFPHRTFYWGTGSDNKWLKDSLSDKGMQQPSS